VPVAEIFIGQRFLGCGGHCPLFGGGGSMNFWRDRLRDCIFGLQDSLISTSGALLGIAAGTNNGSIVALSGVVIVTVESLSMAAGSYISAKSNREYLERLIKEEETSIAENPEQERKEIWEMYRARGFRDQEIKVIEKRLFSDKRLLLEDMAHKELGICPQNMEEPVGNALVMGLSYVAGGMFPVAPYWFLEIKRAMSISLAFTIAALFIIGGLKGKLVNLTWWKSGLEMTVIAGFSGIAGYAIGFLAKHLIHGVFS
jgi:predicted membrane protein (TIGR00267 family)